MDKMRQMFFPKPSPTLHNLCLWKGSDDDGQWAQRAIEHLIKKLKRKKGALEDLEEAIASRGDRRTKCVTIIRSLDGRLQVSHRKGLPHVIYCKVWRWRDLQSHHELRPIDSCQHPFSSSRSVNPLGGGGPSGGDQAGDEVCINPYHYERIENPPLQPILVPRTSLHGGVVHQQMNAAARYHPYASASGTHHAASPYHQGYHHAHHHHHHHVVHQSELGMQESVMPPPPMPAPPQQQGNTSPANVLSPAPSSVGSHGPNSPLTNPNSPVSPRSNDAADTTCYSPRTTRAEAMPMEVEHVPDSTTMPPEVTVVPYRKERSWCTVTYYELNVRIGDPFHATQPTLSIDGFTGGSGTDATRFSLGNLSNVSRNNTVENTRRHIGRGVTLTYTQGEVIAECHPGTMAVFVQSRLCNLDNNFHSATVCKIPPGCELKIFSLHNFARLLQETARTGSYEHCFELTKMCVIRLSFVKGWGTEYQRQDITSCPCWIEIGLDEPLHWLDRVLTQMDPPTQKISSQS